MLERAVQVVAVVVAVGGVGWLALTLSFRTRFRPVQDAIRRLNRSVLNPRQLQTAGRPGASASVVHHVGRTSGTSYRTPVVAVPTDGGFVVALPYGPHADWVRNVRAAGTATIEHEGRRVRVAGPELRPAAEANQIFPPRQQRTHRLYGVHDVLFLRRANAS
jgi:deazaflavin-dependent oxidoreductase (nitroreductase family)